MKITFVCTGNTCRSPMLARMFEDYAAKVGFECVTDSAGMKGGGSPVNPKAGLRRLGMYPRCSERERRTPTSCSP